MAITIYTDDDIRPGAIAGQRIAIIGYGSQGRAHAQNLKDSGHDVVAGVRHGGKGWKNATADGVASASSKSALFSFVPKKRTPVVFGDEGAASAL